MKKGIDYVGIFVTGFCHDGEGNIVWRKRGPAAFDERGAWDPGAGGSLEHGETIEEGLRREIKEEIMVDVLEHQYLGHFECFRELEGKQTHWIGFYYKCLVDRSKVRLPNYEEADELIWQSYHNPPSPQMTHFNDEYETFKQYF